VKVPSSILSDQARPVNLCICICICIYSSPVVCCAFSSAVFRFLPPTPMERGVPGGLFFPQYFFNNSNATLASPVQVLARSPLSRPFGNASRIGLTVPRIAGDLSCLSFFGRAPTGQNHLSCASANETTRCYIVVY
jgi:hypothetical protein